MSSSDESTRDNSVTLMTLHAAKGLEFPVVFIVGMEEGLSPSSMSSDEDSIEEELRLAYVGVNRAKKRLFLTFTTVRFLHGKSNFNTPSRFLAELGYQPDPFNESVDNSFSSYNQPKPKSSKKFDPFYDDIFYDDEGIDF